MHWIEVRFEGRVIASVPFSAEPPDVAEDRAATLRFVRDHRLLRDDQIERATYQMVPSKGEDCTGSGANPDVVRVASQAH
jgi:hypothetical protein